MVCVLPTRYIVATNQPTKQPTNHRIWFWPVRRSAPAPLPRRAPPTSRQPKKTRSVSLIESNVSTVVRVSPNGWLNCGAQANNPRSVVAHDERDGLPLLGAPPHLSASLEVKWMAYHQQIPKRPRSTTVPGRSVRAVSSNYPFFAPIRDGQTYVGCMLGFMLLGTILCKWSECTV